MLIVISLFVTFMHSFALYCHHNAASVMPSSKRAHSCGTSVSHATSDLTMTEFTGPKNLDRDLRYDNFLLKNYKFFWSGTDWKFLVHGVRWLLNFKIFKRILSDNTLLPRSSTADLLMTLSDLFSTTKMNRSESFGIIPNIYENSLLRKVVIMVSFRGML